MTLSQALATPVDEIMWSMELATRNGFHLEPRCRACRNYLVAQKDNDMLATGARYAQIVRALAADNAELDKCDRVSVNSIRNHCGRHFPVQLVARATYRDIVERRAQENGADFVKGVATALTPVVFFEVVVAKTFSALVNDDTDVSVETRLRAAEKLEELEQHPAALDVEADSFDDADDDPYDPTEFIDES